ncbi:hypothetical protein BDP81DRAFT_336918 [Colletotrichum phormii]|uniref:DUF6604 domain-containing protein n=1 Tax=Colletotrichum phormii TaxID=359342 RepID=A0AAI9ZBA6_9PEZI|nr:uncharacterized protein BDP81DRAFT_336918 [Colletotrichum phormii]KAK1613492.1 hypothetical protein BDP81DRAFT_336918 [Colletotrichum phormii]
MLSSGLLSTYNQYKRDTDVVSSWLATTAMSSGYPRPLSEPPAKATSSVPTSERLKGKARKEAKKQPAIKPAQVSEETTPKHIIAIKDFLPLAQFVSGKLPDSIKVPESFMSSLNRVIETRKRFSSMLGGIRRFKDYRGDNKHAFFVTVLERVRDAFKSQADAFDVSAMQDATRGVEKSLPKGAKHVDGPKNMLAILDVYEPSKDFLAAPDVEREAKAPEVYMAEEDDSDTAALFMYTAYLKDLGRLRKEILQLWAEYKSGDRDLAAVSIATNTALQLARNMEQEIAPSMEKLGGAMIVIQMFYEAACAAQGQDPLDKQWGEDLNFNCYDDASDLYFTTLSLLYAFSNTNPDIPNYSGKFGWYNDKKRGTSARERWAEDKAALLEVFADQTMLFQLLRGSPVHDEFTKGLKALLDRGKLEVWLCFSAQVYLDILKSLGPSVRNGERDFQRSLQPIAASVKEALRIRSNREATVKENMGDLHKLAILWGPGKDPFNAIRIASRLKSRASNFLEHHPMYCGLFLHYVRTLFHRVGAEYAAKPGNVLHGIQLYQALQQEGFLQDSDKWDALDSMMEQQGGTAFFVGDPPVDPDAYFKNFELSKGVSAAQWIQKRNKPNSNRFMTSKAGIRIMKFNGVCSCSFAPMVLDNSDPRGLNAVVIDQILERSGWLDKANIDGSPTDTEKSKQKHRALLPSELVRQVALAVHDEVPELTLDYFHTDHLCKAVLKRVREKVDVKNGGSIESSQLRALQEDNPGNTVGIVFAAVVGHVPVLSPDQKAPLREAAEAFKSKPTLEDQQMLSLSAFYREM